MSSENVHTEMLNSFFLENFKAFKDSNELEIKPITLVYGPNSSGKSSLIKALQTLSQTDRDGITTRNEISLDGTITRGEGFKQIAHKQDINNKISFGFSFKRVVAGDVIWQNTKDLIEHKGPLLKYNYSFNEDEESVILESLELSRKYVFNNNDFSIDDFDREDYEFYKQVSDPSFFYNMSLRHSLPRYKERGKLDNWIEETISLKFIRDGTDKSINSNLVEARNWIADERGTSYREQPRSKLWWLDQNSLESLRPICDRFLENQIFQYSEDNYKPFTKEAFVNEIDNLKTIIHLIVTGSPLVTTARTRAWPEPDLQELPAEFYVRLDKEAIDMDIMHEYQTSPLYKMLINSVCQEVMEYFFPRDLQGLFESNIKFIGPLRSEPQRVVGMQPGVPESVGTKGDHWVAILNENPELNDPVMKAFNDLTDYELQVSKIEEWAAVDIKLKEPRFNLLISPSDAGFGFSQILPILVQGLYSKNDLICVEQPETHIHPQMQANLAEFFVNTALSEANPIGNNWLIETHSELIALRLLKKIRNKEISHNDVAFYYCSPEEDGSVLKELRINENGQWLDAWPSGFFEESFDETFS